MRGERPMVLLWRPSIVQSIELDSTAVNSRLLKLFETYIVRIALIRASWRGLLFLPDGPHSRDRALQLLILALLHLVLWSQLQLQQGIVDPIAAT